MKPDSLFPKVIDNTYQGRKVALWLLGILALLKATMGLNSIFNGYVVATTADGIPLHTFTPAGTDAVITFLAFWGLAQLLFALLAALALVRYRAMVPLVFLLLLVELLGRRLILMALPIAKAGSAAGVPINAILAGLLVVGLVWSLMGTRNQVTQGARS